MNFPPCHIEFSRAWPVLSPQPGLSFGICIKKKISSVTRITRVVTASGRTGEGALPRARDQSTVEIHHTAYRRVVGEAGRRRGQNWFTCAGASHSCTPTSWSSQTTDRIRGFSCKGPSSSLCLNLVWQQPPQTQMPLYDHLITHPPSLHAHAHSVDQLVCFYSHHCLCG